MSAVYHGRQRPSHEGDDISALYMQAMNSLEDEELDPSRARAPQGAPATASRPDLTTPAGGYDNNNLGPYGRSPPPSSSMTSRTTPGARSRPLPAVPGGGPPPPMAAPTMQAAASPGNASHYPDSRPSTGNPAAPYAKVPYVSQPTPPSHRNGTIASPPPPPPHLTNNYLGHRPTESNFTGSHHSHESYPNESSHTHITHYSDPRYAAQPYPTNQIPEHGTYTYGNGPTNTSAAHTDFANDRPKGASPPMISGNGLQSESPAGSPYSDPPYSGSGSSAAQNPHYTDTRNNSYRSSDSKNASHFYNSPLAGEGDEDAADSVGNYLMRSRSTASSFASAGSLLQEPRYSPTLDSGLLTPTSTSRVSLPAAASHDTTPRASQYPTGKDFYSSSGKDSYSSGKDLYSPSSAYQHPAIITTPADSTPGGSSRRREYRRLEALKGPLGLHEEEEEEEDEDLEEDRFVNLSLLSHIANRLRDRVPRGTHVKGSIPYPGAFTGKDIVSTIQTQVQKEFQNNMGFQTTDRRAALQVARSLQSQLFFYEVEWGGRILQDGLEDVYMFLDDNPTEGGDTYRGDREELPTGVVTLLTKCYSPSCMEGMQCYSYACPRRASALTLENQIYPGNLVPEPTPEVAWGEIVDKDLLKTLPEAEIRRQTIISKVILKEQQYVQDLDLIETIFIKGLRRARPPIIPVDELEDFIQEVFGNFFELRQCNRRLLDVMFVRQREQAPIIQRIGDIFLQAAAEFRMVYPVYVGNLPVAQNRIKEESENNAEFRRFLEQSARMDARRLDLKTFIARPTEHLQKYPLLLEAIFKETSEGNPDADFLVEAEQAIRNLSSVAQLRTFQSAMGRGPTGKLEWHDLVPKETRNNVPKQEAKRQAVIWELIKTEMVYVKDLETIETIFIRPLRNADIIPRERLPAFLQDVFHNFAELHGHHRRMLDRLHEIQRDEHPFIRTVTAPVFDAALNWRDAYMEYIPHYPIAAFRIDDEMANNPSFKAFIEQSTRHPDSRKLDLKAFINRPIPRLLRYELLLRAILEASPPTHEDQDAIPQVLDVIKDLGKGTEPGVQSAKQKVELWRYHANLVFKPGEAVDMDLLDETRTLIHTGKLLRQPETQFDITGGGWTELYVLLFDNYLVMTKAREKDGITKYHVNRRPIPLDLLSMLGFSDQPMQRLTGLLRPRTRTVQSTAGGDPGNIMAGQVNGDNSADSRFVYPLQLHHNGRAGGIHMFFAESAQARQEWKAKLEEALGLRRVVHESNKVFEIETLSLDTFLVPSMHHGTTTPSWNEEGMFTGKVTCSVPFTTADGRGLVAIGCAEGVWIGLRHDSKSMRRVLHLKLVTQCAMLEDFGIFLVLADKSLFAYHIEALVPSTPPLPHTTRTPQKLNGNKDVQFFSVGTLGGRTLIIYMKKKGVDSIFRVLEPVVERIAEKAKTPNSFGRFTFGTTRSEWFRIYRDFFLPSEAYDLIFLKAKIAILCGKGFEIMDLTDFKSVTIPQREDPRIVSWSRRLDACRPLGMFRSSENEFLLCYNEFGMYVDRHGDPSRPIATVEWEGTAEKVACHPPYILLFDPRFIEIRHIETGRLAQIIPGHDVRCLWDGRGGSAPPIETPGPDGWQEGGAQDARVHAAMRADDNSGATRPGMKAVAQHVFELLPTIPLYLPGSLASPSQSTYFPQSSSPPHSPRLNPAWRP